jgi:DNA-binding IclR family transcriptional regulator
MSSDLVKSAARALEILEVFATERKRMNSAQLGVALGYPKSSLSVLLKSLVAQGYLANGNGDQDYFPTLKLARLGEWIPAALLGSDALLPMLAKLRDETGETVTLTMATDLHMRCLHALIGTHPISLQVEDGVSFPMVGTAIGTMYLATQDEKFVLDLLSRWAKQHPGQSKATIATLHNDIEDARTRGVSCAYDIVLPDTGAIAMPIRTGIGEETLIVAVAGLNHRMHQKEASIIHTMRKLIGSIE